MAPAFKPTPGGPTRTILSPRVAANYTYKIAALPAYDETVEVNAANADFVGRSPSLAHMNLHSWHFVPMRQFVAGDSITFDLKDMTPPPGMTIVKVTWLCRKRAAKLDNGRVFMGTSNDTAIKDGDKLVVNGNSTGAIEHWGMWAEIEVRPEGQPADDKIPPLKYTTADPEGVIGNGV